jgi:hypothetical protein
MKPEKWDIKIWC